MDETMDQEIERILASLTLEEKIALCSGADFWHSKSFADKGIPSFTMTDGPHGLRLQRDEADMLGINDSVPSTCFPTAVTAGATWNRELIAAEGKAIGAEALQEGVHLVLGPGCNIKRDPLCGRNFEYFSEDPFVAGAMAASFVQGQQSTGAASCVKHFAANNQEFKRQNGDSLVDERTLREIYLAPFETAVTEGKVATVMCSYNKINGTHASDNKWLLTDVLRDQWGFEALVVTDWGALNDRVEGFKAGCDLNMPGGSRYGEQKAIAAVADGTLSMEDVDASARRMIAIALASQRTTPEAVDFDAHHDLACKVAEQGAVLLKNDGDVLPAAETDLVIIGTMAENFRYQGAGSSHINPVRLVNLVEALPEVPYCPCGNKDGNVTDKELARAAEAARNAKVPVVVAGLPEIYESEGFDRESMSMPNGHIRMIETVAAANPRTVVVLLGGSAMETPWIDQVAAVLYMGLSGQAGGQACANLLTGKSNPGGKLTETWPCRYCDVPTTQTFGRKDVEYREGIYVGYRYYEKAGVPVRFPFGHGLSYTDFSYTDLSVGRESVWLTVTNTGACAGDEIVQLYIAAPQDGIHRPRKELKGFTRVHLESQESKRINMLLDVRSFAIWDDGWATPSGTYTIMVGSSSADIRLSGTIDIAGDAVEIPTWQKGSWYEAPKGKPCRDDWETFMGRTIPLVPEPTKGGYTLDNTFAEMKENCAPIRRALGLIEFFIARSLKCEVDYSNPDFKVMMTFVADCPIRALCISSGGAMNEHMAQGLLTVANGHFFKGLGRMIGGLFRN